jgi:hypothetical protein
VSLGLTGLSRFSQLLINAQTGRVESSQNDISGNATTRELYTLDRDYCGWVKLLSQCLARSKHKEERAASPAAAAPMSLKSQSPMCLSFRWACSFRCNRPLQSVGGYRYEVRFRQRLRCLQLFRLLQRLLALLGHFILLHVICPAGHRCPYMHSRRQSLLANREHVRTTF